jgi:hypothetical protein
VSPAALRQRCLSFPGAYATGPCQTRWSEDSYDLIVAAMPRAVRERLGWAASV